MDEIGHKKESIFDLKLGDYRKIRLVLTFLFLLMMLSGCETWYDPFNWFTQTKEELTEEFISSVKNKLTEIPIEYDLGDKLKTELSDGTKIIWIINNNLYFDDNLTALGTDNEGGISFKLTARFVHKSKYDIDYSQEFTFTMLDSFIRNTENGIEDVNFYNYLRQILDQDGDNRIHRNEANNFNGKLELNLDNTGIVSGNRIQTTKGLHLLPNITEFIVNNISINNIIIEDLDSLQKISINSGNNTIDNFVLKNLPKLKSISFGTNSINSVSLSGKITAISIDFSNKNIRDFSVIGNDVTVFQLDLSGNSNLNNYEFLSRINKLEKLSLRNTTISTLESLTIPVLKDLKDLNLANNENIESYSFISATTFPNLERIDFTSNKILDLTLSDFKFLKSVVLEQLQLQNISHLRNVTFEQLPVFTSFGRSPEITILNLKIDGLPSLQSLDLSVTESFTMNSLDANNSGINTFIKNDQLLIKNLKFSNLYNMKSLEISKLNLDSITFFQMDSLENLKLNFNQNIKDYGFVNNASLLKNLDLSNNDLSNEKLLKINNREKLTNLNISYNPNISNYSFLNNFPNLEILNLRDNGINETIFNTIPKINKLKELYLINNNCLTNLNFNDWENLVKIEISTTNESEWLIDNLILSNLQYFLILSRATNTKINNIVLTNLPKIEELDLSYSNIRLIDMKNIPLLRNLNLTGNNEISIKVN